MKLERIRLHAFRRFTDGLTLDGLTPGLNLFVAPNEAGKSTVATALRAAFLERYRTSTVTDFQPWGQSGARPGVELDFTLDGHHYALGKWFLQRPRCELNIDHGAQQLEGEQAEDHLAELLGFSHASRGASRDEQAGLPGLLWVRQGETASLASVAPATESLRAALLRLSGELAAPGGDALLQRAEAERATLLTSTGKPRAALREAEEALASAQAELARQQAALTAMEQDIRALEQLQQTHAEAAQSAVWLGYETQAEQVREQQAALAQQQAQRETLRQSLERVQAQRDLLHSVMAADAQADEQLQRQRAALPAQEAAVQDAATQLVQAREQAAAATQASAQAQEQYHAVQQAHTRATWTQQAHSLREAVTQGEEALVAAQASAARLAERQAQAARLAVDAAALRSAESLSQQLTRCEDQLRVQATRLNFRLAPDVALPLSEVSASSDTAPVMLSGTGARWVSQPMRLRLADGSELDIVPGGADLPGLAQRRLALQHELQALFAQWEVADLPALQQRARQAQQAQEEADLAQRELQVYAPAGLAALTARLEAQRTQWQALQVQLESLPASSAPQALTLAQAEAAWRAAQSTAQAAQQAVADAQATQARAQAAHQALVTQVEQATAAQAQRAQAAQGRPAQVAELDTAHAEQRAALAQVEAALAGQPAERLAQEYRRLVDSAQAARSHHQRLEQDVQRLQGRLDQAEALGLGEQVAQQAAECERLARRHDQLDLRARALDLLVTQLRAHHDQATQRLLAPLAQRMQRYLDWVLPGAQLEVDADLQPSRVLRDGQADQVQGLSLGAREQLGVLARLAYADLLREAGRPTLLVLDDAMVHTDAHRRERLKQVLYDAAQRHQILLFTCHERAWDGLGVAPRPLASTPGTDA